MFTAKIKLEKLYTATTDGFDGEKYHAKCNNKNDILTVVESEHGMKFGGYTSVQFDSTNKWYADSKAFVFSLSNRTKHPLKDTNSQHSFYHNPGDRIIYFGNGGDILIYNDCQTNHSNAYSNLGYTYQLPAGMTYNTE